MMKVLLLGVLATVLLGSVVAQVQVLSTTPGMASSGGYPDRYQSVSGDFARAWLASQIQNPNLTQLQNMSSAPNQTGALLNPLGVNSASMVQDLWNWGGVPKGKTVMNGQLVQIENSTANLKPYDDWLGTYMGYTNLVPKNSTDWIPPF